LGGETTVKVSGDGIGGRNQELALAAAIALEGHGLTAVAAVGTDGVDGPTSAAGAIVTGMSARRARQEGMDPAAFLNRNDSHTLLAGIDALLQTGPTGTNVNDLIFILCYER
jgi:glycerate-2-kinase